MQSMSAALPRSGTDREILTIHPIFIENNLNCSDVSLHHPVPTSELAILKDERQFTARYFILSDEPDVQMKEYLTTYSGKCSQFLQEMKRIRADRFIRFEYL